jgi:hypothetical protein
MHEKSQAEINCKLKWENSARSPIMPDGWCSTRREQLPELGAPACPTTADGKAAIAAFVDDARSTLPTSAAVLQYPGNKKTPGFPGVLTGSEAQI